MLRVARRLADALPLTVRATCLAAHALPPEYAGRADDYITHICDELLPCLVGEGLVDAVDAFCEHLAFTPAQVERVFIKARALGCRSSCTPNSCLRSRLQPGCALPGAVGRPPGIHD